MCINLNKLSLCHFYTLEVAFSQASKSILHGFICRDLVGNESWSFITLKQQRYLHHRNLVKNWKAKELWSAGKWKAILYHLAAMAGLQVSLLDICDARSWNSSQLLLIIEMSLKSQDFPCRSNEAKTKLATVMYPNNHWHLLYLLIIYLSCNLM